MAELMLTKVWVNLVRTGEAMSGQSMRERTQSHEVSGDVQQFAGGRSRGIGEEGIRSNFEFTMRDMSLEDIETLKTWFGETVLARDHRGQHFYGAFYHIDIMEMREPDLYDIKIPLRTVTFDEGV